MRDFEPSYNKDYKYTFPNPAHKTYSECYDLDLNLVAFELETSEVTGTRLFSAAAPRSPLQIGQFTLHDPAERRHMFDFSPDT